MQQFNWNWSLLSCNLRIVNFGVIWHFYSQCSPVCAWGWDQASHLWQPCPDFSTEDFKIVPLWAVLLQKNIFFQMLKSFYMIPRFWILPPSLISSMTYESVSYSSWNTVMACVLIPSNPALNWLLTKCRIRYNITEFLLGSLSQSSLISFIFLCSSDKDNN